MDEKTAIAILAWAAGLSLPADRLEALVPAIRRLDAAIQWVYETPLGFTEPALTFDVQARRLS
jgi:hypothetical protein